MCAQKVVHWMARGTQFVFELCGQLPALEEANILVPAPGQICHLHTGKRPMSFKGIGSHGSNV